MKRKCLILNQNIISINYFFVFQGLEKSINAKIEHEVTMTANSVEPKSFHVVKSQHAQEASTSKANKT